MLVVVATTDVSSNRDVSGSHRENRPKPGKRDNSNMKTYFVYGFEDLKSDKFLHAISGLKVSLEQPFAKVCENGGVYILSIFRIDIKMKATNLHDAILEISNNHTQPAFKAIILSEDQTVLNEKYVHFRVKNNTIPCIWNVIP